MIIEKPVIVGCSQKRISLKLENGFPVSIGHFW